MPAAVAKERDLPANLLPLVAPFDGVVVRRDLVIGEMADPARPSFVLADTRRLWLQLDVRQEAQSILRGLAERAEETVHLGVASGTDVVYLEKVESPHAFQMRSRVGERMPIHSTGLWMFRAPMSAVWVKLRGLHGAYARFSAGRRVAPAPAA